MIKQRHDDSLIDLLDTGGNPEVGTGVRLLDPKGLLDDVLRLERSESLAVVLEDLLVLRLGLLVLVSVPVLPPLGGVESKFERGVKLGLLSDRKYEQVISRCPSRRAAAR